MKSNGSGPYCVPVGSNGTGTSKSSGSNTSVSWYREKGAGLGAEHDISQPIGEEIDPSHTHIYENYVTNNEKDEFYTNGVTRALIHQESFDNETFLPTQESPILSYSHFDNDGNESPPLECNKTLLSSKSDRTM